jgi:uncharacterized protein
VWPRITPKRANGSKRRLRPVIITPRSTWVLYEHGLGVAQDYDKAREWYQKAADAGNTDAMYILGVLYEYGYGVAQDYDKAREWYQKAADAGNNDAKQALAHLRQK